VHEALLSSESVAPDPGEIGWLTVDALREVVDQWRFGELVDRLFRLDTDRRKSDPQGRGDGHCAAARDED
jgi:hypothetical protein